MRTLQVSLIGLAIVMTAVSGTAAADRDTDAERDGTVSEKIDRVKKKVAGEPTNREQDPVKAAQKALGAKGYDVGEVDGQLGPKTRAAIQAFQKDEGIRVTGRLDSGTMARLRAGKADDRGAASTERPDRSASASPPTDRKPRRGPGVTRETPERDMARDVHGEQAPNTRK